MWRGWAEKSAGDYSFHVAVTWWSEGVHADMGTLVQDEGVNSFKHFMAYKNAIMCDDETLVNSFKRALELGAMPTVHAENGELVFLLQQELLKLGHHRARRPSAVAAAEGRGRSGEPRHRHRRRARRADLHRPRLAATNRSRRSRARAPRASASTARCWPATWSSTTASTAIPTSQTAAAHVMSPPFRPKEHQEALWHGLQSGQLHTTATDHCTFCAEQKASGKDDFTKIPNGCGGIEDRMRVIWDAGVNTGRLTPSEFVAVTSTNCAQLFNIYPRKAAWLRAPMPTSWCGIRKARKTISAKTQFIEGRLQRLRGPHRARHTRRTRWPGKVVFADGDLRAVEGAGRYIKRPPFGPNFDATAKRAKDQAQTPVARTDAVLPLARAA